MRKRVLGKKERKKTDGEKKEMTIGATSPEETLGEEKMGSTKQVGGNSRGKGPREGMARSVGDRSISSKGLRGEISPIF